MDLDVIIPTYNRCASLERAIRSLLEAPAPSGLRVRIMPVDNRSTDATREVVHRLAERSGREIVYLSEGQNQGRSFALNKGIEHATGDLIGFIDDDEEIDTRWYEVIFEQFRDPGIDYIGGPYRPRWATPPPAWVDHPHTRTAVGWADFGDAPRAFSDEGYDALLMGGNSVLRRSCFERVGLYCTSLGRTAKRLFAGEDTDMHDRLIAAGLKGFYRPDLIVDHHIPVERLAKRYVRRWAYWASASDGVRLRINPDSTGPKILGLPPYYYGDAVRALFRWGTAVLRSDGQAKIFHEELSLWRLAGRLHGLNLMSQQPVRRS
jgi:glycosyltransferase involved in cell wall biosynthesis